ncbi:MAG TPA: thiolase domain-containing protein [Thermoplasmata archaeon]|jgi:acetyl-CoA C-acetyltransferase|nr:thiolase domain-containing protein [Thermoplasmata archaeon]
MKVAVTATGVGKFGKRSDPLLDLLCEAGREALDGIGRKPVDLCVVAHMAGGSFAGVENTAAKVADQLGLDAGAGLRVEAASASGAAAFQAAVGLVASGGYERALVVAGEKMTDLPSAEVAKVLARSLATSEIAHGATMPALAALVASRYLERYAVDEEALDAVTVAARAAASRNPNAQFPTAVTTEEVRASRPIALPLRLLHCSAVSDGAAAVVLERATGPAGVLGLGQATDHVELVERPELTSFRATRVAAKRAYEAAHQTRKELDFAELHDAFSPFAIIDLEDVGITGAGEGAAWFRNGSTLADGRFPVNPSGGILGRGHPVGASGLVQIAEVARQLRGEAGRMAVARAPKRGLAQSIGGLGSHNFVTILGHTGVGAA